MARSIRLFLAAGVVLALFAAGCGSGDAVETGADTAASEPAAVETSAASDDDGSSDGASDDGDAASTATSTAPAGTAVATTTDATVPLPANHSFSEDVLPILQGVCAQCHTAGGPGSTHMQLSTALDAAQSASAIGWATESMWMPPWPASDLSVAFKNDFSLTDEQRTVLQEWVGSGAELDVDPNTPIVSTEPLKFIADPDLILTSTSGAYTGSTDVLDNYRCAIYDPEVTDLEWILSSHFEPDKTEVVHHAIVTLASKERRAEAERLDAQEEGAGWTCYSGSGVDNMSKGYAYNIAGWAPGAPPSTQPEGYAIPLNAGDFIIVQIHYHFDETAPADLSRFVLDLASDLELAAVGGSFKTLTGQLYLGPAEIPCYEGDTNPLCDRDAAIQRVAELYGGRNPFIPDFMLAQCGSTVRDYAEMTNGTAWSTCELNVGNPGLITSVSAHMHELGLAFRMTLLRPDGEEIVLLDIPDWDFGWQFGYTPVDDIIITRQDKIRIDCSWNRERAPYEAVGYIVWADGTGDEMCYSNITTAPQ